MRFCYTCIYQQELKKVFLFLLNGAGSRRGWPHLLEGARFPFSTHSTIVVSKPSQQITTCGRKTTLKLTRVQPTGRYGHATVNRFTLLRITERFRRFFVEEWAAIIIFASGRLVMHSIPKPLCELSLQLEILKPEFSPLRLMRSLLPLQRTSSDQSSSDRDATT